MLIEEKARAYDRVSKEVKDFFEGRQKMYSDVSQTLEYLFSELKEPEDEKIRKTIIRFFKDQYSNETEMYDGSVTVGKAIAWLEKQGEQKNKINSCKFTCEDILALECSMKTAKITKGGDELYKILVPLYNKIHNAYLDELQGEQKPVDKVEPKFNEGDTMRTLKEANDGYTDGMPVVVSVDSKYYHCNNETIPIADQEDYEYPPMNKNQKTTDNVGPKFKVGDWIVNNVSKDIFLIRSVNSGYCSLEDTKGNIYVPCLPFESDFHLWTIQDAKDGDVLICGVDEKPFIFKGLLDPNYPNCPVAYCGIGPEGYFYVSLGNRWTGAKDSVYPATKKQRDLLFSKMKKAGYEWDADKKELSKRVIDEGKSEMDYCFTKMMNGEKVSPIWSEEDTFKVQRICKYLEEAKKYYADITKVRECIDWLKSIKDRIGG